jgi:hypothetical protein
MEDKELEKEADVFAKAEVEKIFSRVYGGIPLSAFTTDFVKRSYDDRDLEQTIKEAYKKGVMKGRSDAIKEFKKIIEDAIEKSEKENERYEEWIEADALEIIIEKINNMK